MAVYPAASFASANTESLSRDNFDVTIGAHDCTLIAWCYRTATSGNKDFFSLTKGGVAENSWLLNYNGTNTRFGLYNTSGTFFAALATPTTLNTWVLVVATYTYATGDMCIYYNAGASKENPNMTFSGTPRDAKDQTLCVGNRKQGGNLWDGRVGPVGICIGAVLSQSEQSEIYNSGAGRLYASLSAGLKAKISEWWDLTETSAGSSQVDRASSVGSRTLTDNNTCPSADGPVTVPVVAGGRASSVLGVRRPIIVGSTFGGA